MQVSPHDFRTFQAVSDLRRVRSFLGKDAIFPITKGNGAHLKELCAYINSPELFAESGLSKPVVDDIWNTATAPEDDPQSFQMATSLLLSSALKGSEYAQHLSWVWEDYSAAYKAADAPVRAALMNGFERLRLQNWIPTECKPASSDLVTKGLEEVENLLIPISKTMTDADIDEISRADYGMDFERHKAALVELLQSPNAGYSDDPWYPGEVVELTSHVPGKLGHTACTAIVFLDAVRNGDDRSNVEFRYQRQWRDYKKLPPPARSAFLAALRYLYETDEHWAPHFQHYDWYEGDKDVSIGWAIEASSRDLIGGSEF